MHDRDVETAKEYQERVQELFLPLLQEGKILGLDVFLLVDRGDDSAVKVRISLAQGEAMKVMDEFVKEAGIETNVPPYEAFDTFDVTRRSE